MWYCYKITNKINGKFYIGKGKNIKKRWQEHRTIANGGKKKYPKRYNYIHSAISKYGSNNFIVEMIGNYETEQEAFAAEINFISKYRDEGFKLYNLTNGGEGSSGSKRSAEFKEKNRIAHLGRRASKTTRRRMSIARRGKPNEKNKKHMTGENNFNAKLTRDKVSKIRELYLQGKSQTAIAVQFNISVSTINGIVRNRTWKNI